MNQIVTCLSAMMRAKGQSASEQPRTFVPPKKIGLTSRQLPLD